jgi:hypothetical protein
MTIDHTDALGSIGRSSTSDQVAVLRCVACQPAARRSDLLDTVAVLVEKKC